jgi:ankyrin repeat protein
MRNKSDNHAKPGNKYIGRLSTLIVCLVLLMIQGCAGGIHQAAETGDVNKIEAILAKDPASIDKKDSYGMTPLHWAVDKGRTHVVELLIAKGANINAKDKNGDTPLSYAITNENSGMATLLLLAGTKIPGKEEELKEMLKKISPLHRAVRDENLGDVKTFLEKYPDQVNARDEFGRTPLYWAAREDNIEICEILLSHGADINAATPDGWTPLHTAVYNKNPRIVVLLIEKGADVNVKNSDSETPLHWAARRGEKGLIEPLIAKGAALDARDNNGKTPLDWTDDSEVIKLLNQYKSGKSNKPGEKYRYKKLCSRE